MLEGELRSLEEQLQFSPEVIKKTLEIVTLEGMCCVPYSEQGSWCLTNIMRACGVDRVHELESLMITEEMAAASSNIRQKVADVQQHNYLLSSEVTSILVCAHRHEVRVVDTMHIGVV